MDKIAAYEMLLEDHPLWTKEASARRYLRLAESPRASAGAVENAKQKFLRRAARYKGNRQGNNPGPANLQARRNNPGIDAYADRVSGASPAPKKIMSGRSDTPEAWLAREAVDVGWLP